MWGHMDGYGWGGMGMGLGMLLFWGLLIAAIAVVVKILTGSRNFGLRDQQKEKSALDILKERYARGEIEREEFEQKKRDLES